MKQFVRILTIGSLATLLACGQTTSNTTCSDKSENPPITKPVEKITAKKDQLDRRATSEDFCRSKSIPVYKNPNSLFVDSEETVSVRTQDEVVDRALALCYIGLKSEGLEQKQLDSMDKAFNISEKWSSNERAFATATQPTDQRIRNEAPPGGLDKSVVYERHYSLNWLIKFMNQEWDNVTTDT